ncbi:MAG TPA: hypothetical protein VGU23_07735, partial [Acidobacteriaceae bacterium]|nr:hypothetical protein [Acidobacteriaceae bacterium]
MTQRKTNLRNSHPIAILATVSFAGLAVAAAFYPVPRAFAASSTPAATAPAAGESALADALDAELKRAMSSLGSDTSSGNGGAAAKQGATAGDQEQPKPYFLSYAVSDSDNIGITAQFGAITGSNESRRR